MTCLHRYWLKEFTKFFCIIQMMILVLFVFIDYLSRMDRFLEANVSLLSALWYVILKVPFMFVQLTPAGILLATIAVFGLMNRNNELTALKSSGISVYFLVRPAILAGIVLAGVMFFMGESLIPVSMAKANHFRQHEIKKQTRVSGGRNDIWIKSGKTLIHINYFDPAKSIIADVSATTLGDDFKIVARIDAKRGIYELGNWILEDITEQAYNPETDEYDVELFDMRLAKFDLDPEDLGEYVTKSDEMSFFELKDYVAKVESEGYDATTYKVDMYGKIAFPFICIIMSLIGAATGMRRFVRTNLPVAIAVGVVISFFYWILYGFSLSMGYAGVLPALVAPLVANLFFLCIGLIYLINTE